MKEPDRFVKILKRARTRVQVIVNCASHPSESLKERRSQYVASGFSCRDLDCLPFMVEELSSLLKNYLIYR